LRSRKLRTAAAGLGTPTPLCDQAQLDVYDVAVNTGTPEPLLMFATVEHKGTLAAKALVHRDEKCVTASELNSAWKASLAVSMFVSRCAVNDVTCSLMQC
jgi:hypothetical protein